MVEVVVFGVFLGLWSDFVVWMDFLVIGGDDGFVVV